MGIAAHLANAKTGEPAPAPLRHVAIAALATADDNARNVTCLSGGTAICLLSAFCLPGTYGR